MAGAWEGPMPIKPPSFIAEADLSAAQFHFVEDGTADLQIDACDAATDVPIGVLLGTPKAGQEAEICSVGICKVKAGAAILRGALIGTGNAGKAVPLVPGTDITKYVVGRALTAAAAADVLFTAMINCASPARAV